MRLNTVKWRRRPERVVAPGPVRFTPGARDTKVHETKADLEKMPYSALRYSMAPRVLSCASSDCGSPVVTPRRQTSIDVDVFGAECNGSNTSREGA